MRLPLVYLLLLLLVTSCEGSFSTLAPAGESAEIIRNIFWWMFWGGLFIWLAFTGITLYVVKIKPRKEHNPKHSARLIIGGGVVFPIVVLSFLIYFSLRPLPELLRPAPEGSVRIEVTGYQWWWRVRYFLDGKPIELANEIHLPLGEPVQFILKSEDVIHSFWVPSLGGKMDMIPGHETRLALTATKQGEFGGVCAEYCGDSHALMKFRVKVSSRDVFDRWLHHQARPIGEPSSDAARRGRAVFINRGCLACHAVRGIDDRGVIAPDLTHVGGRLSLGAGILPNDKEAFKRWITETHRIKPGVNMPSFDMIPPEELEVIGEWLEELK